MSLPASITGAHAKKHGEDLSENDGDEDEGIFHGEQRWCMNIFKKDMSPFYNYVFLFFANAIIRHPCLITICRTARVHVSECDGSCSRGFNSVDEEFLT